MSLNKQFQQVSPNNVSLYQKTTDRNEINKSSTGEDSLFLTNLEECSGHNGAISPHSPGTSNAPTPVAGIRPNQIENKNTSYIN